MGGLVMGHGFGLRMIEGHIYIYTHIFSMGVPVRLGVRKSVVETAMILNHNGYC